MAWPCISRVCCLARFWNQFDKSDLSVPLTTHNYSDIPEHEVHSVTKQLAASYRERAPGNHYSTANQAPTRDGDGTRGSFRAKKEEEPGVPFPSVTQYKQDFKPWPIPRKENFPWISNGGSSSVSPANTHLSRGVRVERGRGRQGEEESNTSSYRHEYRPWTGAKPAKSTKKTPPAQYSSPGTESSHTLCETSYQAAYSVDIYRSSALQQQEHAIPSAASNVQPAAVPLSMPSGLHVATSPSSSSLQRDITPERTELSRTTKGEEHLVRTKIPPNTSALFQSGSRV
ncbi:microtubule-associated protein 6 [Solea solea]|uniref:microtubule-associated protein 6 n=1 Tax=Solea solea TaxID=90069 RepID=UPI0027297A00|nr:microtubule-associated protein 6 [Solea solea]